MPDYTPGGIQFPTEGDKIKDGTSPSALADNFKTLALSADAQANAVAEAVRLAAIVDAATKYGGLPGLVDALRLGTPLGTENLTTILAPGNYYQASNANATLSTGYPVALAGDLVVRPWGAPGSGRFQRRYYPYLGGKFYTQMVSGGASDPWIIFDSVRDTDWRLIDTSSLSGSIRDPAFPGTLKLRRVGATVTARIEGVKLTAGTGGGFIFPNGIPTGFTGWNKVGSAARGSVGDAMGAHFEHDIYVTDNDIFWAAATTSSLAKSNIRPTDTTQRMQGEISWTTDNTFPGTLPGTPA